MPDSKTLVILGALALTVSGIAHSTPPVERPHRIALVSTEEPGERLHVSGVLHDSAGAPLAGYPIHTFQTDAAGYYRRGSGDQDLGWRRARLSARLRTDDDGGFEVDTVRPGSYPGRSSPAHIHFRFPTAGGDDEHELTLFFEDDPMLTPQMRTRLTRFTHNLIRPIERGADGVWRVTVILERPE